MYADLLFLNQWVSHKPHDANPPKGLAYKRSVFSLNSFPSLNVPPGSPQKHPGEEEGVWYLTPTVLESPTLSHDEQLSVQV